MWRPIDYSLRGTLCPVPDLLVVLDRVRRACGLSALVLLAHDGHEWHPDASAVVAEDGRSHLLRDMASVPAEGLGENIRSFLDADGHQREDAAQRLRASVSRLLAGTVAAPLRVLNLGVDDRMVPLVMVLMGASGDDGPVAGEDVELLLAMLNSTVVARGLQDAAVMARVHRRLIPHFSEPGTVDLREFAHGIAALAREVTNSEAAVVHSRGNSSARELELLASVGPVEASDPAVVLASARSAAESHRAAQRAYESQVIISSPIPGALGSPSAPAVGALTVVRQDSQYFSAYDLALLRNICLRMAILQSTAATGGIAKVIADLFGWSPAADMTPDGLAAAERYGKLPPDIKLALVGIEPALASLAVGTNSLSVSVRLALADPAADGPHGLALRRVATYPPLAEDDPLPVQRERDGGLNWRTILGGKPIYAADIANEPEYRLVRLDTRSELSVPVRAEGRLLGTLNLESGTADNYTPFLSQVQAFAGAVGRCFADAAAVYVNPMLEDAAQVLDSAHEYSAEYEPVIDEMKQRSRDLPEGSAARSVIETFTEDALSLIRRSIHPPTVSPPKPGSVQRTVGEVLDTAVSQSQILGLEVIREPDSGLDAVLKAETADLLSAALRNVLRNVRKYTGTPAVEDKQALYAPTLFVRSCLWDGRRYVVVQILNTSSEAIDQDEVLQIYRVPVARGGYLRLGSYLAALRMRQMRGMIHFSIERNIRARTTVLIPIPVD